MKKVFKVFDKLEELIASSLLLITSMLVFVQVILRYQFSYSISWSEELSRMMIAWFIFIGSSLAVKDNAHINMDALFSIAPEKVKKVLAIVIDIINIIFCVLIIYAGFNMVRSAMAIGSTATSIKMPLYIPYASVPVGVFLMLIRYIISIKSNILNLIKKDDSLKNNDNKEEVVE